MNKEPLLYLCHRIPYPPNKGDKIRSFNILKKLSEHFDVHLACFVDDPFDRKYVPALDKYCKSVLALNQNKLVCKVKGLTSFLTNEAISIPYYSNRQMTQWVKRTVLTHEIENIFVYSSSMAQYCTDSMFDECTRVIDFVDVDSDKWRQYAEKKTGIAKFIFDREYKQLAKYEAIIASQFDHSLFVSPDEAGLFKELQPVNTHSKIHGMLNGVDVEFFNPSAEMAQESLPEGPFISFTGAMDYWANIESVHWFVDNVWSSLKAKHPELSFCIVGGNPSADIQALSKIDGIVVTGRVHDIRPYIAQASCVVAPMRIARGIQNKVLEAMSLNKVVVCTTMAMEGINAESNDFVAVVDSPQGFIDACSSFVEQNTGNMSIEPSNRQWIIDHFTWQQTLTPLLGYFASEEADHD